MITENPALTALVIMYINEVNKKESRVISVENAHGGIVKQREHLYGI